MAATHRVRLLAPHLPACGWDPIVLTVDPSRYEYAIDPELDTLVPADLRVERCRAWATSWTRRLGIGDLGLRALVPTLRRASAIVRREPIDAVFITTYPIYTAAVGPLLKRRFGLRYVVDLQDPWVGAWGREVGGGPGGSIDLKSRVSRSLAAFLEPRVLGPADALMAVSQRTLDEVYERVPGTREKPHAEIPIGGDAHDFDAVAAMSARQTHFDPGDGHVHICAVGALLPMATDVARALFAGLAQLRSARPDVAARLRIHFFGTSNERGGSPAPRALPLAREAGVGDLVTEHAARIDYVDALRVQRDASALLLLGSVEPHYTASRLFPSLLARRPLIAVYHEASTVTATLRRYARPPTVQLIAFDASRPPASHAAAIAQTLQACAEGVTYRAGDVDPAATQDSSAPVLARRLADLLDEVAR